MRLRNQTIAAAAAGASLACQPSPDVEAVEPSLTDLAGVARSVVPSDWPTYGANPRRTSVAPAWCRGPLALQWSFHPEDVDGREARAKHVVVDDRGVFVSASVGDSTSGYGLRLEDGSQMWVYDSRTDIHHARWPGLAFGWVVLNDDGLFVLDPETGVKQFDKGVDWWGQTLTDGERLYLVNTYHIHGPRVFVAALDKQMEPVWEQNVLGAVPEDYLDRVGAIALDEGTLFQAVNMRWGALNGLFAFDAATGDEKWSVPTYPAGAISASSGQVYGVERDERKGSSRLAARAQADGSLTWSEPVEATDRAAPVIAEELLITFSGPDGVVARDAATGRERWRQRFPAPDEPAVRHATHLGVAWLSRTVVVAAGDQLALLNLDDGAVRWTGMAPGDSDQGVHSPVVAAGMIYVVRDGTVYAMACA